MKTRITLLDTYVINYEQMLCDMLCYLQTCLKKKWKKMEILTTQKTNIMDVFKLI